LNKKRTNWGKLVLFRMGIERREVLKSEPYTFKKILLYAVSGELGGNLPTMPARRP
jgi:hypothetical protein